MNSHSPIMNFLSVKIVKRGEFIILTEYEHTWQQVAYKGIIPIGEDSIFEPEPEIQTHERIKEAEQIISKNKKNTQTYCSFLKQIA